MTFDLTGEYTSLRSKNFPVADTRRFVHLALEWILKEPLQTDRMSLLHIYLNMIPPQAYTGKEGVLVIEKEGVLIAQRGEKKLSLELLCTNEKTGHYDPDIHPRGIDYAWIDTGSLALPLPNNFLMNVGHIVSPCLRAIGKRGVCYENLLGNAGNKGHAYFCDLTIEQEPFDIHHPVYGGSLGNVLGHSGRSGLFVGQRLRFSEVDSALWGLGGDQGKALAADVTISQKPAGPYSLACLGENRGDVFLTGPISYAFELQHAGMNQGQVRIFAPHDRLTFIRPHQLQAVCSRADLRTALQKNVDAIEIYCMSGGREIPAGYFVRVSPAVHSHHHQVFIPYLSESHHPPCLTVVASEIFSSAVANITSFENLMEHLRKAHPLRKE